ncbi:Acetylornithine aminotransferase [Candidatus Magnetomoraceae bacterium gMMP-15]
MNTMIEQADKVIANTYARFPLVLTKGKGCTVWDSDGNSYTDFVAGIAVCSLGHAHPKVAEALSYQASILIHVSNLYYTEPQIKLASWLVDHSFADKAFFCNSGAEANEAAIKLARKYFQDKGETKRKGIITLENSFHGRTMATLSATGQEKIQKGFNPLVPGFKLVPFNDTEALSNAIDEKICAVMLEPIQGEGGVCVPDSDYLKTVRKICDENGILLIFDEIQTGMGRTGKLFAYEHFDVEPDIMTLAKALANGLPIGAMLAREEIIQAFGPGSHATTFGGTPLITATAFAVVSTLEKENIIENCARVGSYFKERLIELKGQHDVVKEVRGHGLLLGMELKKDGGPIVESCMKKGFLINCAHGNVLRFIPPLIITEKEIDALIECLSNELN